MENDQKVFGGRAQAIQLSRLAHEALSSLIMHGRCPQNQRKTTLAGVATVFTVKGTRSHACPSVSDVSPWR